MIAYVPRKHVERTADNERITLTSTSDQGIYLVELPEGTLELDVLDPRGDRMEPQPQFANGRLDIRSLRAGTYTIRAHTADGITIRRFALLGTGASLWAIDAEPVH
jgi:hypothetical protein